MTEARIGDATECLTLTPEPESGQPERAIVRLTLGGLTAVTIVVSDYANGFHDLASYFESLAMDWRGWSGTRRWESLEGDLRLDARHAHGHVQVRVTLRREPEAAAA